jgi:hypothetical protein
MRNPALSVELTMAAIGLSDERAARFMVALRRGTTRHLFGVNMKSLELYFTSHPDYAREARPLLEANALAARRRKGERKRKLTTLFCLKGLHPMSGNNLMIHKGRRVCRACWRHHATHPPIHSILPVLDQIKKDLRRGISLRQIIHGRPTGGGEFDCNLVLVRANVFYRYRQLNPDFDRFVRGALASNKGRGQKIWMTRVHTSSVRDSNNDYYKIRNLIPERNPHRDDIVARIFEDLLSGSLERDEVPDRVKTYVAEMNKLFPTKYAKFGDSPLVSLDEVLFEDGATTRADTVSRGLWD